jgi:hypothetical protein
MSGSTHYETTVGQGLDDAIGTIVSGATANPAPQSIARSIQSQDVDIRILGTEGFGLPYYKKATIGRFKDRVGAVASQPAIGLGPKRVGTPCISGRRHNYDGSYKKGKPKVYESMEHGSHPGTLTSHVRPLFDTQLSWHYTPQPGNRQPTNIRKGIGEQARLRGGIA